MPSCVIRFAYCGAAMGRRSTRHMIIAAACGLAVAVLASLLMGWMALPSVAWDAAAIVFLVLTWREIWPLDAGQTKALASSEEPSRTAVDVTLLLAAVVSLSTVVLVLSKVGGGAGLHLLVRTSLGIVSVVLAWAVVHTVYTLRYARLYYANTGGINFNGPQEPSYADFAYVAFGIGMAFQVADTNLTSTAFRRQVLFHALLSFMFATTILAVTINLVAGINQ